MRRRIWSLFAAMILVVVSCGSSEGASVTAEAADDPLAEAVDRALADCFDPLHDSDGSGGFFAFCERATRAKSAGHLDCFDPRYAETNAEACTTWRVAASDVPPYYFEPVEPVEAVEPVTPSEPLPVDGQDQPADEDPMVDAEVTASGLPVGLKVLEWNMIGGCEQLGDYCARHSVYADGRVIAARASGEVLAEARVDVELVDAVVRAADVDTVVLLASLGRGPCRMAVDGIDHEVWIGPADLRINTCDYDLSGDDPLIMAARILGESAAGAAPVDWAALAGD